MGDQSHHHELIADKTTGLFGDLRLGEALVDRLREKLALDFKKIETKLRQRHAENVDLLRRSHSGLIKTQLAKLLGHELPSQLEWDAPNLRTFSNQLNGGIESCHLRFGSAAVQVLGKRVRIPLSFDIESGAFLVVLADEQSRNSAVSVFRSIILRYLVTVKPGLLNVRCFDGKEHGVAFSSFIQNLPRNISGGKAGVMPNEFDDCVRALDERIAFVSQNRIGDSQRTLRE